SFPTLVVAAPDGKILHVYPGYLDVARCHEMLLGALATLSNPAWMTRDYDEAVKAVADAEYARAVALLRGGTDDGQGRPVQVEAGQPLLGLEQQASGRLAQAKQLAAGGQTPEAITAVQDVMRVYAGTRAAEEGGQVLTFLVSRPGTRSQARTRRAQELLA